RATRGRGKVICDPPSQTRYGGTSQSLKSGVGKFTLPGARRPRLFTRCDLSLRDGPGRAVRDGTAEFVCGLKARPRAIALRYGDPFRLSPRDSLNRKNALRQ